MKGVIPDMFSDSERYIQLQNVYREQADADAEEVMRGVRRHLEAVGRPAVSERERKVHHSAVLVIFHRFGKLIIPRFCCIGAFCLHDLF